MNSYNEYVLSPVFHNSKNRNSDIYKVMIITFIIASILTSIHNYLCIKKKKNYCNLNKGDTLERNNSF